MPMTTHPTQFGKVVDLSSDINLIPNNWGLINRLGLFEHKYGRSKTVMIPRTTEGQHLLDDRNWDERNPSIAGAARDYLTLPIPHYPVDDAITPNDIDSNLDWASIIKGGMQLETIATKRVEKMARIRGAHSLTLEMARMQAIKDGTVFSPRGTVNVNYYTEYGVVREVVSVDLDSTVLPPNDALQNASGYLQDQVQTGEIATDFVALCSPSFFSALTNNPFVTERYFYVQNAQQQPLLVGDLSAGGALDARYRSFDFAGITFIEVRGGVAGIPYIEDGDAYMFPRGTSSFETWFAPANRLSTVNKTAADSYWFEYINEKDDLIEIMTETNFLNILKRPDLVITLRNEA